MLPAGAVVSCKSTKQVANPETAGSVEPLKRKGRVVEVRSSRAVEEAAKVNEEVLKEMLEQGLGAVTDTSSSKDAWHSLLTEDDIIGMKLNGLQSQGLRTNPPMTRALLASLVDAGFKPQRIVLIEAEPGAVEAKTRPLLEGLDEQVTDFGSGSDKFKKYLTEQVTALINVPLLRDHNIAGVSIGLKNLSHGTIANPWNFHDNNCDPYISDINALAVIKEKRKLTICNALRAVFENGPDANPLWTWNLGGLLFSTDPVALDAVGLHIITEKRREKGRPPLERVGRPPTYIQTAEQRGLGAADLSKVDWAKKEV